MTRRLKVAAAQYPIDRLDGWQAYEAKLAGWVEGAVAEGAQLLVFPEYGAMELASLFPEPVPGELLAQLPAVASLEGRVVELHRTLARRHGVHILGASLPVEAGAERFHNRAWLYGPDGGELARDDDGGDGLNSWLEFQAPAAGAYYVEARGFTEDAAGRYAINLVGGEIGDSMEGADSLQPNGDARTSFIGAAGDADWFAVELIEGRPYRFYVDGLDPDALVDPLLVLYDATGAEVARDDDGGHGLNSYLYFASPTGGPYFAAVTSYDGQSTGRYTIRAVDTDVPGHAYTDEILDSADDARASRIEIPGDIDVYRVTLEAGVMYQIEANGSGATPLADPFLSLVQEGAGMEDAGPNGPDAQIVRQGGRQVASDDDSGPGNDARLRFRPETSGDYLIQVSGLSNTVGGYEVKIVRQ